MVDEGAEVVDVVEVDVVVVVVVVGGLVVGVLPELDPESPPVVDDESELPVTLVVVVVLGVVSSPLSSRTVCTCCCTPATAAATAAGVPPVPNWGSAPSWDKILSILCSSGTGGCDLRVTTIWSAMAVVEQAGQFELSEVAWFTGAITLLCPTIRTTWKETATVVQPAHFPTAAALFVGVTAWPPLTVTSE